MLQPLQVAVGWPLLCQSRTAMYPPSVAARKHCTTFTARAAPSRPRASLTISSQLASGATTTAARMVTAEVTWTTPWTIRYLHPQTGRGGRGGKK